MLKEIVGTVIGRWYVTTFGITFLRLASRHLVWRRTALMVTLSYTFMSYFAFATSRVVASGLWRLRSPIPVLEYGLDVVLAVWGIWVVDPISRLGAHFFWVSYFVMTALAFGSGSHSAANSASPSPRQSS